MVAPHTYTLDAVQVVGLHSSEHGVVVLVRSTAEMCDCGVSNRVLSTNVVTT
jgi:hypothetical protein